jgi:hypothetical protein
MVGGDLGGRSNVLPPTLALIGVMWLQVGAVLLFERPGPAGAGGQAPGRQGGRDPQRAGHAALPVAQAG